MEGKILGIPLILILLVLSIAVLIDVPMIALYRNQMAENYKHDIMLGECVARAALVVPTPVPTVTTTPTPVKVRVPVKVNTSTPAGQIIH